MYRLMLKGDGVTIWENIQDIEDVFFAIITANPKHCIVARDFDTLINF